MHELSPKPSLIQNITGISVIFDWGMQDRGKALGLYSQADIVDLYGYRLNEELDYENVRTHYINTRATGIETEEKRVAQVPSGFLPVFLSCDWHNAARQHNASLVEYSGDLHKFAKRICESLSDWGKNYVWGHRVSHPIVVDSPYPFIRIKPFAPNGPHAEEYLRRMDKLGEEIGRAVGDYLRGRNQGLRNL